MHSVAQQDPVQSFFFFLIFDQQTHTGLENEFRTPHFLASLLFQVEKERIACVQINGQEMSLNGLKELIQASKPYTIKLINVHFPILFRC